MTSELQILIDERKARIAEMERRIKAEAEAAYLRAKLAEALEAAKSLRAAIRNSGQKRHPDIYPAVLSFDMVMARIAKNDEGKS